MESERFDCIVVGGGIAGLSAAMVLAENDMRFLLLERGSFFGSKNVSGGVLWGNDLETLVPEYWKETESYERYVRHRRLTLMDGDSAFSLDFKSDHFADEPYAGLIVLRARFDAWLAEKVQEAIDASSKADSSFIATDVLVDELLVDDSGAVKGIRTGDEAFASDCVIIAEGVNNLLTRQIGLQKAYVPVDGMATAAKEIIRLDQKTLEDRFQLTEHSGLTNEFLGEATAGVEGGGFLYTNKSSVSIGVVLAMESLKASGATPYDILNRFKEHPVVVDMLRGGEVVEYSAHVVTMGDMAVIPREIYADGVMVAGEAAHLVLNSGKAIQGMDYAMRSGILAAETAVEAKRRGSHTAVELGAYRQRLEKSYVMKDLRSFQGAVDLLHTEDMFATVPNIICEVGRDFFTIKSKPTPKVRKMVMRAVRKHSSFWKLIRLGRKMWKSL